MSPDRVDVIARQRLADAKTPCITSSFQAEDVVLVHLLREVRPDIPVLFLETFHHFPQTLDLSGRDRGEVEPESDQPEGARAAGRPVADEHGRLLRAPQGRAAVRRARGLRHLVHGAAARPVAVARQPPARRAVHAEERQGAAQGQSARRVDDEATSGSTRRRTTSRCCRSTSLATRASAASRAPRSDRSVQPALGPLAGPEARMRDPHRTDQIGRMGRRGEDKATKASAFSHARCRLPFRRPSGGRLRCGCRPDRAAGRRPRSTISSTLFGCV